ncbi:MAG: hypothetical protein K6T78_16155 [Alicyclobacillus sp.]|nr:hypothetical protein [Alicyclobacillus sp.]
MTKIDVDALSQVLEHLTDAYHHLQAAAPLVDRCGAFGMLAGQILELKERLCSLTEIAAALMDAKMPKEY